MADGLTLMDGDGGGGEEGSCGMERMGRMRERLGMVVKMAIVNVGTGLV